MAYTTQLDENVNLKSHTLRDKDIREIDVLENVMERVYRAESSSVSPGFKPVKRTFMLAGLIVILASLSAFAFAEIVQIYNENGRVILATEEAELDETASIINGIMDQYGEGIHLAPGEMIAYYVKDERLDAYEQASRMRLIFKTTMYTSYEELLKEIDRTSAPRLVAPSVLPAGFRFAYGDVIPLAPRPMPEAESEYNQLLERLVARAAASTASDQVFTERVEWMQSDGTRLNYTDGEMEFSIWASRALAGHIPVEEGSAALKVKIEGHEAVYIKGGANDHFTNKLVWMDEGTGIMFTIKDEAGSHLGKEDLIGIAESMIVQ